MRNCFIAVTVVPLFLSQSGIKEQRLSVYTQSKNLKILLEGKDVSLLPLLREVEQLSSKHPSLLANMVNTCRGFVTIKPGLGSDLEKDAIKTTVYLG